MQVVIHRGAHQIGGCCTEIRTDTTRILIDLGAELPDPQALPPKALEVQGVTRGTPDCGGVFFTHYHGDHVGLYDQILPGIPLYMGRAAKDIFALYQERVKDHLPDRSQYARFLARVQTFSPARPVQVGDIRVTPFLVDHSAYDAYMFLIEADGKKILHTGDYRFHGFRGKGVLPTLEKYVGQVDLLITEGTTLSRPDEKPVTERELSCQAQEVMREFPYAFLLCSSTNIDRLAGMAAAAKKAGRLFVCDDYQKSVLDVATRHGGSRSSLYDFSGVRVYSESLLDEMKDKGFCMPVRANQGAKRFMKRFPIAKSLLIYSMWTGYRERDDRIAGFLNGTNYCDLHTSGHADTEAIRAVCHAVQPRLGVIPIHTQASDRFDAVCTPYTVIQVYDGNHYIF